jgi:hypothetical protein
MTDENQFKEKEFETIPNSWLTLQKMNAVLLGVEQEMNSYAKEWAGNRETKIGGIERDCFIRLFELNKQRLKGITFNAGFGFWKVGSEDRKSVLYVDFFIPKIHVNSNVFVDNILHCLEEEHFEGEYYINNKGSHKPILYFDEEWNTLNHKGVKNHSFYRVYYERELKSYIRELGDTDHIEAMASWLNLYIKKAKQITQVEQIKS